MIYSHARMSTDNQSVGAQVAALIADGATGEAAAPSQCHLLGGRCRLRCAAARHVPHTVGFGMFLVHCASGNVAGVTGTVGHTLAAKDEGKRAVEHEDTRIKIMRMRLAMPMWFD